MLHLIASIAMMFAAVAHADDTPFIAQAIDGLTSVLGDGIAVEFKKARTVLPTNPTSGEVAVFFTMEGFGGGNSYQFYLALLAPAYPLEDASLESPPTTKKVPVKYRLVSNAQVGGKGWRHIDFEKIMRTQNGVVIQAQEYAPNDPTCCPSKAVKVEYILEHGSLIEVRPTPPSIVPPLGLDTRER